MPRILKSVLRRLRAASKPGLTPGQRPVSAAETRTLEQAIQTAPSSTVQAVGSMVDPSPAPALRTREENASGVQPIASPVEPDPIDPARCKHDLEHFTLPAESKGRVFQCKLCHVIGYRLARFGGPGSFQLYTCSKTMPGGKKCGGWAIKRMIGRGPRGSYIWACRDHGGTLIEGLPPKP